MSGRGPSRGLKPIRRWALIASVGALSALHVLLLVDRLRDLSIGEPTVLTRWIASLLLLVGIVALRRRGLPVFHGRQGAAIALAILLLHAGSIPALPASGGLGTLLLALPFGLTAGLAGAALARRGLRSPGRGLPSLLRRAAEAAATPLRAAPALALRFAPRPPPAR